MPTSLECKKTWSFMGRSSISKLIYIEDVCLANCLSFSTFFNVAYCIMLVPSQVILTYVRPSIWLPGLEICWGVITGLIAITTSAKQVYILRVFLGLCESSAWPGMMTLFSTWPFRSPVCFFV